ncbi:hypothetical protein [Fimbriimonas ginsengisoli]|uniref:Uncharacterized protein n=1 Tax=Fimbriimonas ginsengisoli Gsoil 348 TaxID=661478 RepID=A0A068NRM6_FIMGI|nr:hypothetical protein [Fimbriimonas ginsengisoli]AIE84269.1 hypothetical protein OP10G_0901 [Fimbriimonas ginsengisoli Gsoil 348]
MPFEPLDTDEKLERPATRVRDMDDQMLFGCSGFLVASLGGYALSVWPFFVFPDTQRLSVLAISLGVGLIPAAILTVFASIKFGMAGACGGVGGAIATAMFLYLRLNQIFLAWMARRIPEPEYPASMQGLIPIAWILAVLLIGMAATPRETSPD